MELPSPSQGLPADEGQGERHPHAEPPTLPGFYPCKLRSSGRISTMPLTPLDPALGFGVGRFADQHLRPEHAAEALAGLGQFRFPGPPPSDRTLSVPHQTRGTPPSAVSSRHQPANKSSALRDGISSADTHRA